MLIHLASMGEMPRTFEVTLYETFCLQWDLYLLDGCIEWKMSTLRRLWCHSKPWLMYMMLAVRPMWVLTFMSHFRQWPTFIHCQCLHWTLHLLMSKFLVVIVVSLLCWLNLHHHCQALSRSRPMPPCLPRAFMTEMSVLLTQTVVELDSNRSLHAECAGIRHPDIITELLHVKDARYPAIFSWLHSI